MSDIDPDRCPICREPNDCGLTAGKTTCWCFDTPMPAAALERVPAADRNRSCICQACATGGVSPRAAVSGRPAES
jgi:hypothetical protein